MPNTILKRWNGTAFEELYPKTTTSQIVASGTPSNTTFLRGDGTWATPLVSTTVTIAPGDWSSNTATKTVSGVTTTSFLWISPDSASYTNYATAQIRATAQGTNSITFTCSTTPSASIDVVVVRN